MKFKDLENGMTVHLANGRRGVVYKGFMTYDYIIDINSKRVIFSQSNKHGDLIKEKEYEKLDIIEVRSVRDFCNDTYLNHRTMLDRGEVIWKKPPGVKKMTVKQISDALGYEVEITKG